MHLLFALRSSASQLGYLRVFYGNKGNTLPISVHP